ncbi:hypothetical protein TNCV_1937651 [Trichonephila clavipes]|nr:hypothetical protein TNCV_1937651 [Trichonephila clavipes]
MQKNARLHLVSSTDNFLEAERIQCMEWIAGSPHLNSIRHVWDILRRCVTARSRTPIALRIGGSDFIKRGRIFSKVSSNTL